MVCQKSEPDSNFTFSASVSVSTIAREASTISVGAVVVVVTGCSTSRSGCCYLTDLIMKTAKAPRTDSTMPTGNRPA